MKQLVWAIVSIGVLVMSKPSHADVVSASVDVHLGGSYGRGIVGDLRDESFFGGTGGMAYGLAAGVELLFIDFWIDHTQFRDGDGLSGTWTEFMLGLDMELPIAKDKAVLGFGFGGGFGVGTGRQIEPPLDNSEITDKGFIGEASISLGYRINKVLTVGGEVPVRYGYFIKNGADQVINDPSSRYHAMHMMGLVFLRGQFKLK